MDWILYDNGLRHERVKLKQVALCWRNLEKVLFKLENEIKEHER